MKCGVLETDRCSVKEFLVLCTDFFLVSGEQRRSVSPVLSCTTRGQNCSCLEDLYFGIS